MNETHMDRIKKAQLRLCGECKARKTQGNNDLCNECWDEVRNNISAFAVADVTLVDMGVPPSPGRSDSTEREQFMEPRYHSLLGKESWLFGKRKVL
jgi:hypothetical protein